MPVPRMTTRRWIITIAVLAPIMLVASWFYQVSTALEDFYGENGKLATESRLSREIPAAWVTFRQGRWAEAEHQFQEAARLNEQLRAIDDRQGWANEPDWTDQILLGLAEIHAAQGRPYLAEPLYCRSLAIVEARLGPEELATAEPLERYARFLRKQGRVAEARPFEDRALKILDRVARILRDDGQAAEADELATRQADIRRVQGTAATVKN